MASSLRYFARIQGGESLERSMLAIPEKLRASVRKKLRELGREMQAEARGLAPKSHGYRSPASRAYGPLAETIKPRVRTTTEMVQMSIRPLAFYGLMVETGYNKYAAGQRRWAGSSWRTVKTRVGGARRRTGGDVYADYADSYRVDFKGRKRKAPVRIAQGVTFSNRKLSTKLGTAGKSSRVPGHPYMKPVWERIHGSIQGRINDAVKEALGAG